MSDKVIFGGFGLVILVLVIVAFVQSGSNEVSAEDVLKGQVAETGEEVAALTDRIAELENQLESLSAEAARTGDLDAIATQVEDVAKTAAAGTATLEERVDGLQDQIADVAEVAAVAASAQAAAPAAPKAEEAKTAEAAPASDAAPAIEGHRAGETALFADGALRVFVSKADEDSARLSINGSMRTLATGTGYTIPVADEHCRVTLDAATGGVAQVSALCGADLPAPEGLSAGNTAIFEDGALRVFVSRVDDDAARISVNGDMASMDVGRSVPATAGDAQCRVMLDAVDRGHAVLSADCAGGLGVSEPVGPGSTAVLADGAARVFVASVLGETVRFAVNGQSLNAGSAGTTVDLDGGCAVTVEDVLDSAASFSYACN